MKLAEVARIIDADYSGPDIEFNQVSIDSRDISKGQLFIAISGEHFDGHDFVEVAAKQGAVAAVVSKKIKTTIPCLIVTDTRKALAMLASHHRQTMPAIVMGMTGSCGKTTVKTLLAAILSQHGKTLSNIRSFNNNIGVPLTLLQISKDHQYAVCEMGANHAGEIANLTHMVKPDVAAITNAAAAHLEGFGDVRGVACAKSEIFQGLGPNGIAVINADDDYAEFWKKQVGDHRIVTFGRHHAAEVMAKSITLNAETQPRFTLVLPNSEVNIQMRLLGEHNVMNALTAAAMAYAKGVPVAAIKAGLELTEAPSNRLVPKRGYAGAMIIDDTYNANPLSAAAAISVLACRGGDSVFVLGDMLELGSHADMMHQEIGQQAQQLGVHRLYCYGQYSRHAADAFGENAYHFDNRDDLLSALRDDLHEGTTVLIKGSRAMGMDKIAKALMEE